METVVNSERPTNTINTFFIVCSSKRDLGTNIKNRRYCSAHQRGRVMPVASWARSASMSALPLARHPPCANASNPNKVADKIDDTFILSSPCSLTMTALPGRSFVNYLAVYVQAAPKNVCVFDSSI